MTYLLTNSIFNVSSICVKSMTTCKNVYKKCVYKMLQTNKRDRHDNKNLFSEQLSVYEFWFKN